MNTKARLLTGLITIIILFGAAALFLLEGQPIGYLFVPLGLFRAWSWQKDLRWLMADDD